MNNKIRDKIALLVFLLLFFGVGALLVGYLLVGHSPLNVAASNIDDAAGGMDGYTVIAFEGNSIPSLKDDEDTKPVTVSSVIADYKQKGAGTLKLDTVDPAQYSEGTIVMVGGKRVGIISCATVDEYAQLQRQTSNFKAHNVDYTVCLATNRSLVELVSGLDVVISPRIQTETKRTTYGMVDNTFYVESPSVGQVGVVVISPSNVVSTKNVVGQEQ